MDESIFTAHDAEGPPPSDEQAPVWAAIVIGGAVLLLLAAFVVPGIRTVIAYALYAAGCLVAVMVIPRSVLAGFLAATAIGLVGVGIDPNRSLFDSEDDLSACEANVVEEAERLATTTGQAFNRDDAIRQARAYC